MDIQTAVKECKEKFNERSATLFLAMLLCVDLTYIVLHFIYATTQSISGKFSLEKDGGHPEMFQYTKWFWIIILLGYTSKLRRSFRYSVWALVFLFLLLDDSLRIHENAVIYIRDVIEFLPLSESILHLVGELLYAGLAGIILLSLVTFAYLKGQLAFKKVSRDILLLMLVLVFFGIAVDSVFFGIGVDLLRPLIGEERAIMILDVFEDGGEMFAASLILWYVFLIAIRDESKSSYLCDFLIKGFASKHAD